MFPFQREMWAGLRRHVQIWKLKMPQGLFCLWRDMIAFLRLVGMQECFLIMHPRNNYTYPAWAGCGRKVKIYHWNRLRKTKLTFNPLTIVSAYNITYFLTTFKFPQRSILQQTFWNSYKCSCWSVVADISDIWRYVFSIIKILSLKVKRIWAGEML